MKISYYDGYIHFSNNTYLHATYPEPFWQQITFVSESKTNVILGSQTFWVRKVCFVISQLLGSIGVNTIVSSPDQDILEHSTIYIQNKKPKSGWKGLLCCSAPKCCTANIQRSRSIQKQSRHNTRYKPARSRSSSPPFLPPQTLSPKNIK